MKEVTSVKTPCTYSFKQVSAMRDYVYLRALLCCLLLQIILTGLIN